MHRGIVRGLAENGVDVRSFNFAERLNFYAGAEINGTKAFEYEAACRMAAQGIRAACWDWRPDLVVIVSSFFIPPETYRSLRRGTRVLLWCTESPYEDERQVLQAGHADFVVVNDPQNLDGFREVNSKTWYVPHGYDPAVHHDRGRTDEHPFCFVGTGYESRIEFLEKADLPAGSVLGGNWQKLAGDSPLRPMVAHPIEHCIDNTDAADLYRASATSFNLYRKEAMQPELVDGWAMGPREVELAATGCWYAREPRGEGDELFPMLPKVTSPHELGDTIRWALANPDKRSVAAEQARAAIADRTFANNLAGVLRLIGA